MIKIQKLIIPKHSFCFNTQRKLFGWVNKLKKMVTIDNRSEKEKFLDSNKEKFQKTANDQLDQVFQGMKGPIPMILKSIIRRVSRTAINEMGKVQSVGQEVRDIADNLIKRDPKVIQRFGPDLQANETVTFQVVGYGGTHQKFEMGIVLDGFNTTGSARIAAEKDLASNIITIKSIAVHLDGESEIINVSLSGTGVGLSGDRHQHVIDVKPRDE
jgi:hypothetical protein